MQGRKRLDLYSGPRYEESFAKVRSFAPESIRSDGVVTEGPFRFFKFADPDGNTIEFFSLGASS